MMTIKKNIITGCLLLLIVLAACLFIVKPIHHQRTVSYKVFNSPKGWGYDILLHDTIIIHQDILPVMQTDSGFAKEAQAIKAARLVIRKLKKRQSPVITNAELQSLLLVHE